MRNTIHYLCLVVSFIASANCLYAQQDAPNDMNATAIPGNAGVVGKLASTPINLYTGIPSISIPIYHYSHHNGLSLNVSLDYFAGGVKVNESPTPAGVNWYLNAGGAISRTVRGMPDDLYPNGYLYNGALPTDSTVNAYKYYHDSVDAEMDVFQFNFNGRSGKFFIGKNKQIRVEPLSKIQIRYDTASGGISRFRVTTEDGVRYVFSDREYGSETDTTFKSGYNGITYTRAWYLSQIIAPFGTDTIKFTYNTIYESGNVAFPQSIFVNTSNGAAGPTNSPIGSMGFYCNKPASILFPDKKNISFIYDNVIKYDLHDSVLNRIKIGDSVFRYGYLMDWNCCKGDIVSNVRAFLAGVRYFTSTAMRPEYQFTYTLPMFAAYGSAGDNIYNDRDYWGFFNGASNFTYAIPTVPGVNYGVDRGPSASVIASSLSAVTDPSGGVTYYQFEPNDLPIPDSSTLGFYVNPTINSQHIISLNQAAGYQYTINITNDVSYDSLNDYHGACNLNFSVTSLDGSIIYKSFNTTLTRGLVGTSFTFTAPNGNYLLNTSLSNCQIINISSLQLWVSSPNLSFISNFTPTGGLRLKQQSHFDPVTGRIDTIATYNYRTSDGKSSGFLGAVPVYSFPYQKTVINGTTTTTNYTGVSSEPVNTLSYTQGSPIGYSRVEVVKGSLTHNLGKEVYEFTNLSDANASPGIAAFPYVPLQQRDWAMGLVKRSSIYDSTGKLVSITTNTYKDSLVIDSNVNFQSRKLGKRSTTFNGDPTLSTTPFTEYYIHTDYYPQSGYSFLMSTIDSFYHSDNSLQITQKSIQYDTNFNVMKIISPYDQSRGLSLESRLYYAYNYTLSGAIGKLRDSGFVSSLIARENWITGDANPRLMSAQITDFTQLPSGSIKPLTQYSLQSNAPVTQTTIGLFNPASLVRNATYFVAQQNYLTYDNGGNLLETKNALSGQHNSVIMDYYNQFPVAKVSNAGQGDIAYTSFESDGSGNWTIGSIARSNTAALTGKYSYNLSDGNITRSGLNASLTYLISVWAYTGAVVTVNGTTVTGSIAQQNNWSLFQTSLSGITSVTIAGSGLIDELRLHPKDANMVTTSYEPMVGITSSSDANNTIGYCYYDNLNRPKVVRDKDLNVVKKYEYSDSTTIISMTPNWQNTGLMPCDSLVNGQVDRQQRDINPYSDTYNALRLLADHTDCATCIPHCPTGPTGSIVIGCTCDPGTRINVASVYSSSEGKWLCEWRKCYSNGTVGGLNYEYNISPCTITPGGCPSAQ